MHHAPERTKEITDIIADGTSQYGMQTFDQALMDLYQRELITYEEAVHQATNPDDFALRVRGASPPRTCRTRASRARRNRRARPARPPPARPAPAAPPAAPPSFTIDRFDRKK